MQSAAAVSYYLEIVLLKIAKKILDFTVPGQKSTAMCVCVLVVRLMCVCGECEGRFRHKDMTGVTGVTGK